FDRLVDPGDPQAAGLDAVVEHPPVGEGGIDPGAVPEAGGGLVDDVVRRREPGTLLRQGPVPIGGGGGMPVAATQQRDPGAGIDDDVPHRLPRRRGGGPYRSRSCSAAASAGSPSMVPIIVRMGSPRPP